MSRLLSIIALGLALAGCNNHPVDEPICGPDGDNIRMPTDRELCVYRWPIVIETGFECPAERAEFFGVEPHFGTCSSFGPPRGIERDFLIDRFGVPGRPWPTYSSSSATRPNSEKLDLLWVIDNSGSMCQEQAVLRQNFAVFLDELAASATDFQIAVTTTHMNAEYALEPVAKPGEIQSQPQPVPGFDRSCQMAVNDQGEVVPGDFAPVRQSLRVAVDCMAEPDESLLEVTDSEIECALNSGQCAIERAGCDGDCRPEDLFPDPASYREIPKIMRSSDYTVDGVLDVAALEADFACASMVGTRGHGIEKGLSAAAAAVSPENLAGPNVGMLRPDARFAVMFVSDENDCSHDGSLDESSSCGGDVCEFWNQEEFLGGPLLPVVELKAQLLGNLSSAKGRLVDESEVFAASIHGRPLRFDGERPTAAMCQSSDYEGVAPSCATPLGIAFSGDRYARFIAQFQNAFPKPAEDGAGPGLICNGDFSPALSAMGEWLGAR